MKKAIYTLLLVSFTTVIFNSCAKVEGCTDSSATNYNEEVKLKNDDGSCMYEGTQILWYGKAASEGLLGDGAASLTFKVNGDIVGSSSASVYFESAPNCEQTGTVKVIMNLGSSTSKSYDYSVVDNTGFEYWSGTLQFNANTCTTTELTW